MTSTTQAQPVPLTQAQINANQAAYPNNPYPGNPNYPYAPPPASLVPTPDQQEQARYLTELLNTTIQTVASVVKRMDQSTRGDQETLDLILSELRSLHAARTAYAGQAEAEKAARDTQAKQLASEKSVAPPVDPRAHPWPASTQPVSAQPATPAAHSGPAVNA
jgi:hypothetical protein